MATAIRERCLVSDGERILWVQSSKRPRNTIFTGTLISESAVRLGDDDRDLAPSRRENESRPSHTCTETRQGSIPNQTGEQCRHEQGVNSRGKDLLRLSEQPGTSHDT